MNVKSTQLRRTFSLATLLLEGVASDMESCQLSLGHLREMLYCKLCVVGCRVWLELRAKEESVIAQKWYL